MGRMAAVLGPKTLSEVVLPGSHDSGTSGIDDISGPAVAKAQTRTIGEQLADGIRYFDFRVHEALHGDCANPSVFRFYHGRALGDDVGGGHHYSYQLIDGLQAVKDFCQDPANAKEIIILDFQKIDLWYNDGRATGVLLRTVWDYLNPYVLPFDGTYAMMDINAHTLQDIWTLNQQRGEQRQVVVLAEGDRLEDGQGCGEPWDQYGRAWIGDRDRYLVSYYGSQQDSSGLKDDVDAQLSKAFAQGQNRINLFNGYRAKQITYNLRVLQLVPKPSNGWFVGTASTAGLSFGAAPSDWLLNYGDFINHSFNNCPGGTSGWFGQRLWTGLTLGGTADWNRPNIIIVDNYLGVALPTGLNVQDPPGPPVNWRAMAWDSAAGKWVQTNANGTSYVDYVASLNLIQPGPDPGITYLSTNQLCYKY